MPTASEQQLNVESLLQGVVLTMMLSKRIVHTYLGFAKRQIVKSNDPAMLAGLRSFATTPRSAKTGDPNVEDDNILPVSSLLHLSYSIFWRPVSMKVTLSFTVFILWADSLGNNF